MPAVDNEPVQPTRPGGGAVVRTAFAGTAAPLPDPPWLQHGPPGPQQCAEAEKPPKQPPGLRKHVNLLQLKPPSQEEQEEPRKGRFWKFSPYLMRLVAIALFVTSPRLSIVAASQVASTFGSLDYHESYHDSGADYHESYHDSGASGVLEDAWRRNEAWRAAAEAWRGAEATTDILDYHESYHDYGASTTDTLDYRDSGVFTTPPVSLEPGELKLCKSGAREVFPCVLALPGAQAPQVMPPAGLWREQEAEPPEKTIARAAFAGAIAGDSPPQVVPPTGSGRPVRFCGLPPRFQQGTWIPADPPEAGFAGQGQNAQ